MTFDEVYETLPAKGWLSEPEARLLWAAAGETDGPILEVGCYHGRSTVLLAALGRPLYCVDPFANFDDADPSGEKTLAAWTINVTAGAGMPVDVPALALLGLNSVPAPGPRVTLFRQRIKDWRPRPVGLAYLDGDHTFEGTVAQVRRAVECGPAVVAVHDVSDGGGGVRVRDACLEQLGAWDERVDRLAVWRTGGRTAAPGGSNAIGERS